MRISDWSSDVCSSDLSAPAWRLLHLTVPADIAAERCRPIVLQPLRLWHGPADYPGPPARPRLKPFQTRRCRQMAEEGQAPAFPCRSEEHTSELQSLMRISYAVFCLKTQNKSSTLT